MNKFQFSKKIPNLKLILLSIFIVGFFWICLSFFSSLAFPHSAPVFLKDGKAKLYPNKPISQKFTATDNGLSQLNFALQNADLSLRDKISLELKDENCEKILAKNEINFFTPSAQLYDQFKFPRIANSQGKTYCFSITFEPKNEKNGDYPFINISEADEFKGMSYFNAETNKTFQNRSLVMKTAYANTNLSSNIQELTDRISQYKPWFLKENNLLFIVFFFIILTLCLVATLVIL